MKKLGELLKNEREKRSLSLHEIGMSLKINPKTLQAIEAGEVEKLPAKTFLRGFIKSYAQYLKLNTNEVLNLFQEEMGESAPAQVTSASPEVQSTGTTPAAQPQAPVNTPLSPSHVKPIGQGPIEISQGKILTIAGSIILIVAIVFIGKMVDKYQKERARVEVQNNITTDSGVTQETSAVQPPSEQPAATESLPPSAPGSVVSLLPTPLVPSQSPAAPVSTKPTATMTTPSKPAEEQKTTEKTVPVTPSLTTTSSATTIQPSTTTVAPSATQGNSTQPAEVTQRPTEVIVEALNKVQIRYSLGNDKFETLELAADQFHTFKSKVGVQLEISDGGSVNIVVNGRDKGIPGGIGKPIKLSYPK